MVASHEFFSGSAESHTRREVTPEMRTARQQVLGLFLQSALKPTHKLIRDGVVALQQFGALAQGNLESEAYERLEGVALKLIVKRDTNIFALLLDGHMERDLPPTLMQIQLGSIAHKYGKDGQPNKALLDEIKERYGNQDAYDAAMYFIDRAEAVYGAQKKEADKDLVSTFSPNSSEILLQTAVMSAQQSAVQGLLQQHQALAAEWGLNPYNETPEGLEKARGFIFDTVRDQIPALEESVALLNDLGRTQLDRDQDLARAKFYIDPDLTMDTRVVTLLYKYAPRTYQAFSSRPDRFDQSAIEATTLGAITESRDRISNAQTQQQGNLDLLIASKIIGSLNRHDSHVAHLLEAQSEVNVPVESSQPVHKTRRERRKEQQKRSPSPQKAPKGNWLVRVWNWIKSESDLHYKEPTLSQLRKEMERDIRESDITFGYNWEQREASNPLAQPYLAQNAAIRQRKARWGNV